MTTLCPSVVDVRPADVAREMAVYLIFAVTGVDSGPHVYALGQASTHMSGQWAWCDITTIARGIEAKLGTDVAVAAIEHARRAVRS